MIMRASYEYTIVAFNCQQLQGVDHEQLLQLSHVKHFTGA